MVSVLYVSPLALSGAARPRCQSFDGTENRQREPGLGTLRGWASAYLWLIHLLRNTLKPTTDECS